MGDLHDFPLDTNPNRARPRFNPLTDDEMLTLEASEAVVALAERLGSYKRLSRIVRTMATIFGEEL